MSDPILEMKHITKTFPGVIACSKVNLELYSGEIHALLGENGAGKSTLMNILTGIYKPDAGQIFYKGKEVTLKSTKTAVDLGIGMVHQHFALVQTLSVTENIYLHCDMCKAVLDIKAMEDAVAQKSKEFNLELDAKSKIWQLSVGEQQRVEIVKLLYRGAEILILDEPSAVLTPQESVEMFKTLRKMADSGKVVVFISHKMGEVMANADRITVLRGGTVVDTMLISEADEDRLAKGVVGSDYKLINQPRLIRAEQGLPVLELKDICVKNDKGLPAVRNASITLYEGEILGIAGVAGNGQREITEVIAGLRKADSGTVFLCGEDVTILSPKARIKKGLAFIPEDRLGMGLVPAMNMMENAILKDYDGADYSKNGILRKKTIKKCTEDFICRYGIKNSGIGRPISLMSGGNQQKLLVAREINGEPKLIIATYPVRGLDIGATESIHQILIEQRNRGACIILISEELEKIFEMSDRISVMSSGCLSEALITANTSFEEIGSLMIGQNRGIPDCKCEIG